MSEAQAFVTLTSFLLGFHLSQYSSVVGMTPSTEGGVTYWPEAVRYLVINYPQAKDVTKAGEDLRDTKRKPEEDKKQSSHRMNDAFSYCGNVFFPEKVINIYIDELIPATSYLVQRFCDTY